MSISSGECVGFFLLIQICNAKSAHLNREMLGNQRVASKSNEPAARYSSVGQAPIGYVVEKNILGLVMGGLITLGLLTLHFVVRFRSGVPVFCRVRQKAKLAHRNPGHVHPRIKVAVAHQQINSVSGVYHLRRLC